MTLWASSGPASIVCQALIQITWVWLYSFLRILFSVYLPERECFYDFTCLSWRHCVARSDRHALTNLRAISFFVNSIKDLGPLKYFLEIELAYGPKGLFLVQHKYALEIMDECRLLGVKPNDFSMEENHKLALATGTHWVDAWSYHWLMGRLIYLTITYLMYAMQPIFSVSSCRHLEKNMNAACRVLHYIKGSPDCEIVIHAHTDLQLIGYCDSDWGVCPLTRRSLTG